MNLLEVLRNAKGGITPELVIWAVFIGFSVALVLALFHKRYMGKFVHALLEKGIDQTEKAMTLKELGFDKNPFVKMALRGKTAYSGIIFEKGEEITVHGDSVVPVQRYKVDFETARFYIPTFLVPRAQVRFEKKGSHIMALLVGVILFYSISMVIIYYLPEIQAFIDRLMSRY